MHHITEMNHHVQQIIHVSRILDTVNEHFNDYNDAKSVQMQSRIRNLIKTQLNRLESNDLQHLINSNEAIRFSYDHLQKQYANTIVVVDPEIVTA